MNTLAHKNFGPACFSCGVLAIDSNTNDIQTTNAVHYTIGGKMYTIAAQSAIDISGLSNFFLQAAPTTAAAAPSVQATGTERYYVMVANASGTIGVVEGKDADLAKSETAKLPHIPVGWCAFGAVKVKNETGSNFTFGTTGLDTSNITDTYVNLFSCP